MCTTETCAWSKAWAGCAPKSSSKISSSNSNGARWRNSDDSGIFLRAGLEGKPWPTDGWQLNLRYNQIGGLVKGFKTIVPAETPKAPVNKWVKFRVEVRGTKVKLIVDGEDAWDTDKLDADRGYLGIQAENKAFEFRKSSRAGTLIMPVHAIRGRLL